MSDPTTQDNPTEATVPPNRSPGDRAGENGATGRRSRGRPPKATGDDALDRREALVAAALELFARKGFEGASLAEIAKHAGATPPLVHYYFESKAALWKTVLGGVLAELRDDFVRLERETENGDALDGLERVIRRFIAFSSRHPEVSLILRNERAQEGERIEWLWREQWAPLRALPRRLIVRAQKDGRLRQAAPDHILQIIIGACLHPLRGGLSLQQMYGVPADSREVFEMHADLVTETLLAGLAAP